MASVFLAGLLLAAAPAPALAQELRLAVSRGPVSLPVYVAETLGYFTAEGVNVRVAECSSGRHCYEQLAAGSADVATTAELVMTLESLRGSDAAIIATMSTSSRHIKLVARASAGVKVPQDLRGKRIGTVAGTSAQYFLDSWLVFQSIDPKEVKVSALPPERLAGALQQGEVDAIAIWEPIAASAAAALGADASPLPSARVYTQHFSLIASRQAIVQRQAQLVKLLRALDRAETFIAERPQQARQLLQARLQGEEGAANIEEHGFRLQLPQSLIATMDAQSRWALRLGLVRASQAGGNLLRGIEPSLLHQVRPSLVELPR